MAMKPILIVLILIVIAVVGLGAYRGWFHLSSRNDQAKADVTVSVDKDKIVADKDQVMDKAQSLGHEAADKVTATTQKASN